MDAVKWRALATEGDVAALSRLRAEEPAVFAEWRDRTVGSLCARGRGAPHRAPVARPHA